MDAGTHVGHQHEGGHAGAVVVERNDEARQADGTAVPICPDTTRRRLAAGHGGLVVREQALKLRRKRLLPLRDQVAPFEVDDLFGAEPGSHQGSKPGETETHVAP